MRIILPVFLSIIFFSGAAQSPVDIIQYKYTIELNDNNDSINAVAQIKILFTGPTDQLELDLVGLDKSGKGMRTGRLTGPSIKNYEHIGDKLKINFKKTFKPGDSTIVTIPYSGIPPNGLIISKNKFGRRTFFADNWPDRARYWIPCVDDPADKAAVEFIVIAPAHYDVVSNGILLEKFAINNKKITRWKEDIPLPTKIMVIGVADFAVQTAGIVLDSIPVTSWIFPEDSSKGFIDYAPATEILTWLSNYIGPYPYKKLANIQSKTMFGGMENANAIFYSENSVDGLRNRANLLAHEIAHQWFGDMATEKSFAHVWLSEGFATYMTHLYTESNYGTDSLNRAMKRDRDQVIEFVKMSQRPVIDTSKDLMSLLNDNSYQKGSWILHMLRRELGDSVFRAAIRAYYANYAGKNADSKDLQRIFEMVSGKNLEVFFDQWLNRGVNPQLLHTYEFNPLLNKIMITIQQLQQPLFEFPLEIGIGESGRIEKVYIKEKSQTFSFDLSVKPLRVVLDPNTSLLFERKF